MSDGGAALALAADEPMAVVRANAGGPYGSAALAGVQADSERVWRSVVDGEGGVASSWYKASISIVAAADEPWVAQAVGGADAPTAFEFGPPPGAASYAVDQRNPCVGPEGDACAF